MSKGGGGPPPIVIAGAGSVGCYTGGALALAGRDVTLLLRPALAEAIGARGLVIRDLSHPERHVSPGALRLATDPAIAFKGARLILVTVKSGATTEMADLIRAFAPPTATVVSLQNGTENAAGLEDRLGSPFQVAAGMVPFNVVQTVEAGAAPRFVRATSGTIKVGKTGLDIAAALNVPGLPVAEHRDMASVLWSKLVINLNNAINALCGLPLVDELGDRRWRLILARQQREALAVLRKAGIATVALEGARPAFIPMALALPDALFHRVARQMLEIDPQARSSMWDDLERRRPTEIGELQGAIQRLAIQHAMPVPLTDRIITLITAAESRGQGSPRLLPNDVWSL